MPAVIWTFEGDDSDLQAALESVGAGIQETEGEFQEMGSEGGKAFGGISKDAEKAAKAVGKTLVGGIALATAAAAGLALATVKNAQRLDNLAKQAKRVGTTAGELDKIRGVFDLGGIAIGQTDNILRKFRVNIGKAEQGVAAQADAFSRLGIKTKDFTGIPLEEKLSLVSKGLATVNSDTERAALVTDIFGRSGLDLLPILEQGEAAFLASAAAIEESGVASDKLARQSEDLIDQIALTSRTFTTMKDQALGPLIPAFSGIIEAVRETLNEFRKTGTLKRFGEIAADVLLGTLAPAALVAGNLVAKAFASMAPAVKAVTVGLLRAKIAMLSLTGQFTKAQQTISELTAAQDEFAQSIRDLGADQESIDEKTQKLADRLDTLRRRLAGAGDEAADKTAPAFNDVGESAADAAEDVKDLADELDKLEEKDADQVAAAIKDFAGIAQEAVQSQLKGIELIETRQALQVAAIIAKQDELLANSRLTDGQRAAIRQSATDAIIESEAAAAAEVDAIRADLHQAELDRIEEERETREDNAVAIVNAAAGLAQEVVGIFADMAQDQMRERVSAARETARELERIDTLLAETNDENERARLETNRAALQEKERQEKESALESFRISKALAIVQASISTALAIINAIATAPNIIVGLVLAVVAGALGAVQIGMIAAEQPPSFHSGGLTRARDIQGASQAEIPATLKANEGVLNTNGVAGVGGETGLDQLNRGGGLMGGGSVNIFRFGTRTTEAISHQQLSSSDSRMSNAFRGVRPKVGRSIPNRRSR